MRRFSHRDTGETAMLCTASFLLFASAAALAKSIIDYRGMLAERLFQDIPSDSAVELWENNSDNYSKSEKAAGSAANEASGKDPVSENGIPETEESGL